MDSKCRPKPAHLVSRANPGQAELGFLLVELSFQQLFGHINKLLQAFIIRAGLWSFYHLIQTHPMNTPKSNWLSSCTLHTCHKMARVVSISKESLTLSKISVCFGVRQILLYYQKLNPYLTQPNHYWEFIYGSPRAQFGMGPMAVSHTIFQHIHRWALCLIYLKVKNVLLQRRNSLLQQNKAEKVGHWDFHRTHLIHQEREGRTLRLGSLSQNECRSYL